MKLDPLRDLAFIALTLAGREPRRPVWTDEELHTAEAEVGLGDPTKPVPPPTPPPPPPRRKELFYPPILQKIEILHAPYSFSASSYSPAPGSYWPVENVHSIRLRRLGE